MFDIKCKAIQNCTYLGIEKGTPYTGTFNSKIGVFFVYNTHNQVMCNMETFHKFFHVVRMTKI